MPRLLNALQILLLFLLLRPILCVDINVIQLTDANFQKHLTMSDNLLVMFFVPWSGLCQKMRSHFARAANKLKKNNIPVALGKMDCSGLARRTCDHKKLGHQLPAIHFFQKKEFVKEYKGPRDDLSIVKFIRVQVLPGMVELKDADELKYFLKTQDDVVVIGFFDEDSPLKKMFFKVFEEMKETIIFAHSSCEKVLLKQGVLNGIVLFRPEVLQNRYEEERVLYAGRVVIGEIKNFIVRNFHGLVGHRTPTNLLDFHNPLVVLYYTVDYHSDGKEVNYWRLRSIKVAHKYKASVTFAISAKDDFEEELFDFTVDYTSVLRPFVLAIDLENQKFVMTDAFSTNSFDEFVGRFINQTLTPYQKSIPAFDSEGLVVTAVTNTFEELVLDNGKDTLVDIYAPWSARYKKFSPVMRELADLLLEDNVVIAKIDSTENEVPELFPLKYIPNVFWLSKSKKSNPVLYQGGRTVDEVMKFIARRATNELRHYDRNGNAKMEKEEL